MRFSQAVGVEDILAVDLSEGMLRVLRQRNIDPGSLGNHPGVRSEQLSGQSDNGLRGCLHLPCQRWSAQCYHLHLHLHVHSVHNVRIHL